MALTVAASPERISGYAEPIPSLADADIAAAAAAAADCRVEEVMVFGSVARGEARHGSDIDLLVLTADCTQRTCARSSARSRPLHGRPPACRWTSSLSGESLSSICPAT